MILWKKSLVLSFVVFGSILTKLQSFEFGVSDVILANVQNILSLVFFVYFC